MSFHQQSIRETHESVGTLQNDIHNNTDEEGDWKVEEIGFQFVSVLPWIDKYKRTFICWITFVDWCIVLEYSSNTEFVF